MSTAQIPAAVHTLLDKQEIHECIMRYCRGIDRCDEELIRSAYHPDAYDDHGGFKGTVDEFVSWIIPALLRAWKGTLHFMGNELVEVQGDVAYSESYFVAYHRLDRHGKEFDTVFGGRYVDRFERRNGVWRIARRTVVHDWSRVDPLVEAWPGAASFAQGQRTHEDLVYHR
jgi:ketosteroid isomerase-like protein